MQSWSTDQQIIYVDYATVTNGFVIKKEKNVYEKKEKKIVSDRKYSVNLPYGPCTLRIKESPRQNPTDLDI